MAERLMKVDEVAEVLQVSVKTVQRYYRAGRLRCLHLDRGVRFREEDVQAYIDGMVGRASVLAAPVGGLEPSRPSRRGRR